MIEKENVKYNKPLYMSHIKVFLSVFLFQTFDIISNNVFYLGLEVMRMYSVC